MSHLRCVPWFACLCLALTSAETRAGIVPAAAQPEFLTTIGTDQYVETFDGLMPNVAYGDTMHFAHGDFSYEIRTGSMGSNTGIYPFENQSLFGDIWFSTNYDNSALEIRDIQGGVDAIGGEFFLTAFEGPVASAVMTVFAEGIDGPTSYQANLSGSQQFFGFFATAGMSITGLTIELPGTFNYATLNNLIVARRLGGDPIAISSVPEPSGIALMGVGLGLAGLFARRRRRRT